MRLWTYHSPAFSLVEGQYDPEKSAFAKQYRFAYKELWDRVGCKEIIWCCTSKDSWPRKNGYREWDLDVPVGSFVEIVDSMVWNGILGNDKTGPSGRLRDWLMAESMGMAPGNHYEWYQQEVQRMLHPPGDPWESLFLDDPYDLRADVLLQHPIDREWVISTKLY